MMQWGCVTAHLLADQWGQVYKLRTFGVFEGLQETLVADAHGADVDPLRSDITAHWRQNTNILKHSDRKQEVGSRWTRCCSFHHQELINPLQLQLSSTSLSNLKRAQVNNYLCTRTLNIVNVNCLKQWVSRQPNTTHIWKFSVNNLITESWYRPNQLPVFK